ncbi:MAG: hypothetical protein EA397_11180 [Deltaproteobacteria bacterium]|nr:MAG: hypothetical protein EA397_11180 [Deltaproteobacteria bacterium]
MRTTAALTTFLALTFGSTPAFAGGWADFASAFPLSPCQDGWLGCIVNGEAVGPNLAKDSTGAPTPSDLRVGWFDLEGTASFSPFPELSAYRGELAREPAPEPEVADADPEPEPARATPQPRAQPERQATPQPRTPDPEPRTTTRSAPDRSTPPPAEQPTETRTATRGSGDQRGTGRAEPEPEPPPPAPPEPEPEERASSTPEAQPTSLKSESDDGTASAGDADEGKSEAVIKETPKPSEPEDVDCSNVKRLEPMAMLGRLSDAQKECIEQELASSPRQTDKDKFSRVLMSNAWASNDRAGWEKLVKRHLNEIDRSDPDLCYKYAVHLSRKGAGSANAVIRWADVALENKTVWTGQTYTNRVYALLRLRAAAAQSLWKASETKYASDASDANRSNRDNARNRTKVLAREWYEYAKSAGKSADQARALCMAAAGTEDYCEGS